MFKWKKNNILWYYLIVLGILLVYGFCNLEAAIRLIEVFIKAMEFIINGANG